jgi:hypothetical protein
MIPLDDLDRESRRLLTQRRRRVDARDFAGREKPM